MTRGCAFAVAALIVVAAGVAACVVRLGSHPYTIVLHHLNLSAAQNQSRRQLLVDSCLLWVASVWHICIVQVQAAACIAQAMSIGQVHTNTVGAL